MVCEPARTAALGAVDGHRSGLWVLGGQLCVPLQIADLTAVCLRDPRVASLEVIPWGKDFLHGWTVEIAPGVAKGYRVWR